MDVRRRVGLHDPGARLLVPIAIVLVFNPYETKTRELEEIELKR